MGNDWVDGPNERTCHFGIKLDIFQSECQLGSHCRLSNVQYHHFWLRNNPVNNAGRVDKHDPPPPHQLVLKAGLNATFILFDNLWTRKSCGNQDKRDANLNWLQNSWVLCAAYKRHVRWQRSGGLQAYNATSKVRYRAALGVPKRFSLLSPATVVENCLTVGVRWLFRHLIDHIQLHPHHIQN